MREFVFGFFKFLIEYLAILICYIPVANLTSISSNFLSQTKSNSFNTQFLKETYIPYNLFDIRPLAKLS